MRARLREVAHAVGPPEALHVAVQVVEDALPGSDGRLATRLIEAGLVEKPMHPEVLSSLCRLWRLPSPGWSMVSRAASPRTLLCRGNGRQERKSLDAVAAEARHAGVLPLETALRVL